MKANFLKLIIVIIIELIELSNCSASNYDKVMPRDFSFTIICETFKFDSKTGIYTRSYIQKDSTVKIELTEKELQKVYESFKKGRFLSFPDRFECCKNGIFIEPAFETTLEFAYKGKVIRATNTSLCTKKKEQRKSIRFYKIESVIFEVIHKKTQIREMRRTDLIFM